MPRPHVLRQTVPAALTFPWTSSPPVRATTLLILPRVALTVIPRAGVLSTPPPAGVIDSRGFGGPELPSRSDPSPEQPLARRLSAAQMAVMLRRPTDGTLGRAGPDGDITKNVIDHHVYCDIQENQRGCHENPPPTCSRPRIPGRRAT